MIASEPSPSQVTVAQEEARDELARRSFSHFCERVHGVTLTPHMLFWARHLVDPIYSRVAIVAPPETYKSRVIRMFLEWDIGRDLEGTTLLLMNTAQQAESQSVALAATLEENEVYKRLFPRVIPDKVRGWTRSRRFVARGSVSNPNPTLFATGIDGPYQGIHVGKIITDDLTDQKDVYSPATMEQQRLRVRGVLPDRLERDKGRWFSIYTRWGENDLHQEFSDLGFTIIEMPIVGDYEWGELLFSDRFPMELIEKIRSDKGEGLFRMTYMCDPSGMIAFTAFFDADALDAMLRDIQSPLPRQEGREVEDWEHYVMRWKEPATNVRYVIGADVGEGFKEGDASAATVMDWQTGEVVAAVRDFIKTDDFAQVLYFLGLEYNKALLGVERNGVGLAVINTLKALGYPDMYYADWDGDRDRPGFRTTSRNRPVMLADLEEAVRNRQIVNHYGRLRDEMRVFIRNELGRPEAAPGHHDDLVMALGITWQMRNWAASHRGFGRSGTRYIPAFKGIQIRR